MKKWKWIYIICYKYIINFLMNIHILKKFKEYATLINWVKPYNFIFEWHYNKLPISIILEIWKKKPYNFL
jgi:uncharacterized membrane protein